MAVWAVVYNKWCSPWHRPCLRSPNSPNSYQVVFFYTRSILVKIKTIFIILSSGIVRVVVVVACCLFGSVWNIFYILYRYQFSPYWSWVRFKRPSCLVWRIVKYNSIIFFSTFSFILNCLLSWREPCCGPGGDDWPPRGHRHQESSVR